jgi:uncharacterized protein
VTLILDTGPLISLMDEDDPLQSTIERLLLQEAAVLPAPVSAEVDYMVGRRLGRVARRGFLADLASGNFRVVCLEPQEYELVRWYDDQYAELDVGLADLSIVILARRFETYRILTFDERHFRTLRPLDGGHFVLLPKDAA